MGENIIKKKKKRIWLWFVLFFIGTVISIAAFGYFWIKNLDPVKLFESEFIQDQIKSQAGSEGLKLFNLLPDLLGFSEPTTYLILFQNNTELRPSGGFIGVYAVLRFDKGKMEIVEVQGTENLDRNTPANWKPVPPKPLTDHLKVDRWYFRDSNWSPDFSESSKKVLELYKGEGGVLADDIDMVIGVTPTVLEKVLEITGPVNVQNIKFESENVTEKLEYEVEYGYSDKGIAFKNRKQIIEPFMLELIKVLKDDVIVYSEKYLEILSDLISEKHILAYSLDKTLQEKIGKIGLDGEIKYYFSDYLLWVDANLAALKTDHAMERILHYSIEKNEDDKFVGKAKMIYRNNGKFDWRTSRYRTYARVFVPLGSELIKVDGAMKWDRTNIKGEVDQGKELGKQWFGTFISIEPGEVKELEFSYILPDYIVDHIDKDSYGLLVQKQLGTTGHGLTLNLDFDKNIRWAKPAEVEKEWGDDKYVVSSDLKIDREFELGI